MNTQRTSAGSTSPNTSPRYCSRFSAMPVSTTTGSGARITSVLSATITGAVPSPWWSWSRNVSGAISVGSMRVFTGCCMAGPSSWYLISVVVLEYHDSMTMPRQALDRSSRTDTGETGRVNQKRRTRAAIVAAAKGLMSQGVTPTVAQAAEAALVSRTTAYRYFPTQDSLLLELAVDIDVD